MATGFQALLGAQLVITLVSVIQKLSPHYSLAKWFLCSTGLIRYLHPTDSELKILAGVPKSVQKPKKYNRNKGHHADDKSKTFHRLHRIPVAGRLQSVCRNPPDAGPNTEIHVAGNLHFPFSSKLLTSLTIQYFRSDES
ncbi:hypothetical protein HA402_012650 [Bradysia odoriphaga]|nr:hypothetical protein HA402_012650 [Bradysia odoriphaga]